MSEVILLETVGATRVLTIARAHARNALTLAVLHALTEAIKAAATDPAVRCVVITGDGGHFCAGADLRQTLAEDPGLMDHLDTYMEAFHGLVKAVVQCSRPTIAMMDGAAVGFGADLAFACDLRVASVRAYVQERFVRLGLVPDGGGTFWLPRLLGTARALQMILLAEKIGATELHRLGVVAKVVDPDQLRDVTIELAREIEAGPPLAYAAIKRTVYANLGSLDEALRREREEQVRLLRTSDFAEGVAAWTQKREPRFDGR
jgi:2-(1,2-epoxy-1,2-dihydrophenyl)acetyl-CoA isomerase